MSRNRRQHHRYRVPNQQGTLQFAHPAAVLDLSRTGASIETTERLVPGRSYPLQFEGASGLEVTTRGRVVWCKLTGTRENEDGDSTPIYRAGLEFEESLPEAGSLLLDSLDATVQAVDTRIRARYKMSDLASTLLLHDQASFRVRVLSRSGMGAEMEYSPRIGSIMDFELPLDEPVEVRGRVADVNPAAEDPTRFLVGIEFVNLSSRVQGQLDRYIERLRDLAPSNDSP